MVAELLVWELEEPGRQDASYSSMAQSWFGSCPGPRRLVPDSVAALPAVQGRIGDVRPGSHSLEDPFGQVWQTMQAGMDHMVQGAQQKFELLEQGLQDQARRLQASLGDIAWRCQKGVGITQETLLGDSEENTSLLQADNDLGSAQSKLAISARRHQRIGKSTQGNQEEGDFGFLCVAGWSSAASARASQGSRTGSVQTPTLKICESKNLFGRDVANRIVRPQHGVLSWFWSRPKREAMDDCKKDKRAANSMYRCPVPGCKGYHKSFSLAGLEAHLYAKLHCLGHPDDTQWAAWEEEAKRGHYIRYDLGDEEIHAKRPMLCDEKDPIWIYLPKEPDYSKHGGAPTDSEIEEVEELEEEGGESEAETLVSQYEVEVEEYDAQGSLEGQAEKEKSTASVPSPDSRPPLRKASRLEVQPTEEVEEKASGSAAASSSATPSTAKYVPPHKRQATDSQRGSSVGGASSSKPAPYELTGASRAIVLGEMLSQRIERLEELQVSLDNLAPGESREELLNYIANLELEIQGLKGEQKTFRKRQREGYSARQERDKESMSGRLAYLKEKSRKRAAKRRAEGQVDRIKERLEKEDEWHKRFDRPGTGRKVSVFPLAEGALAKEVQAAPLSKREKTALLEEEEKDFLNLPPVTKRTRDLPPSARAKTPKKKAAKHKRERKREQRRKVEKAKDGKKGAPKGTGHLSSFSGKACSASGTYPGWTRVNFIIDSGASATTIPKELVGGVKLGDPMGYHSFKLANGSTVANEGTLVAKAWLLGDELVGMRMSVADIAQPLLSVSQMVSSGNKVVLSPKVSYLETEKGGIHRIFQRNGVYVLPLWLEDLDTSSGSAPFRGQGRRGL